MVFLRNRSKQPLSKDLKFVGRMSQCNFSPFSLFFANERLCTFTFVIKSVVIYNSESPTGRFCCVGAGKPNTNRGATNLYRFVHSQCENEGKKWGDELPVEMEKKENKKESHSIVWLFQKKSDGELHALQSAVSQHFFFFCPFTHSWLEHCTHSFFWPLRLDALGYARIKRIWSCVFVLPCLYSSFRTPGHRPTMMMMINKRPRFVCERDGFDAHAFLFTRHQFEI